MSSPQASPDNATGGVKDPTVDTPPRSVLQEVQVRPPGRGNQLTDVTALTGLLREAAEHHGGYEATTRKHSWSAAVRR